MTRLAFSGLRRRVISPARPSTGPLGVPTYVILLTRIRQIAHLKLTSASPTGDRVPRPHPGARCNSRPPNAPAIMRRPSSLYASVSASGLGQSTGCATRALHSQAGCCCCRGAPARAPVACPINASPALATGLHGPCRLEKPGPSRWNACGRPGGLWVTGCIDSFPRQLLAETRRPSERNSRSLGASVLVSMPAVQPSPCLCKCACKLSVSLE